MDLTLTYGHMPTREQFDQACAKVDEDTGRSVALDGFGFGRDPRLGTTRLTQDELWDELCKAHGEWYAPNADPEAQDKAGEWCSSVLYCLGIEWV